MTKTKCPLCDSPAEGSKNHPGDSVTNFDCPNCGSFGISDRAMRELASLPDVGRSALSHMAYEHQSNGARIKILLEHLNAVRNAKEPDPAEQLDKLILYIGKEQTSNSNYVTRSWGTLRAMLSAIDVATETFILNEAKQRGLLDTSPSSLSKFAGRLTFQGWERFHELKRGTNRSRLAFMAMKFDQDDVARIVNNAFKSAVAATGFDLKAVNEDPKAGGIINRIRVGILTARFTVADLSYSNNGVYWEAGFAEGLGKPVIYTCKKSLFSEVHFDVKQSQTILWTDDDPNKAAEDLKATIRATLPLEAKMQDD